MKASWGLAEVTAYDPFVEERYVSAVLAFRGLDFNLLSQLKSQKDAIIANIMDSLRLEGPSSETPETSLSDSLDVVYNRVQKVKEGALSHRLSFYEVMGPLVDPLSFENLVGEASTLGVPTTIATTTANVSSIPSISLADYEVLGAKLQTEASHSPKIVFEQETLESSPEHPMSS
ncbi:hypothetical protein Tco_1283719 [Tanacetum coccineum]